MDYLSRRGRDEYAVRNRYDPSVTQSHPPPSEAHHRWEHPISTLVAYDRGYHDPSGPALPHLRPNAAASSPKGGLGQSAAKKSPRLGHGQLVDVIQTMRAWLIPPVSPSARLTLHPSRHTRPPGSEHFWGASHPFVVGLLGHFFSPIYLPLLGSDTGAKNFGGEAKLKRPTRL